MQIVFDRWRAQNILSRAIIGTRAIGSPSLVYADKPHTLDHLEDNIRRVIADIRPQMSEKVIENWTTSEPAVAVLCQKSYLKCNATRLSFE
ncbi:hypothetical protein TNCV_4560591 [Trichonephila clavipes]|nr:hypothetical protein TNCV_4560591 [Trichonephila clavipes]